MKISAKRVTALLLTLILLTVFLPATATATSTTSTPTTETPTTSTPTTSTPTTSTPTTETSTTTTPTTLTSTTSTPTTSTPTTSTPATVMVRIIGQNSVILNQTISVSAITDYTTDSSDTHSGLNALDAIISATELNSLGTYNIAYNSTYGTYYISKLVGITPSGSDYWGTLASSFSGAYDSKALSAHQLTAGDTYVVYYDKNIGGSVNYGYQSYAWFTADTSSGTAGTPIEIGVKTTAYDASNNTVAAVLPNTTVYAMGGSNLTPTAMAVTDSSGIAYITFADAGTYTLTLASAYTYAQCVVTVTGSSVPLSNLNITVTNGTNNLSNAALRLTNSLGNTCSAFSVSSSVHYEYRLPASNYNYYASASGYIPSSGTVTVSAATTKNITLQAMSGYAVTITPGDTVHETVKVKNSSGAVQPAISVVNNVYSYDMANGSYTYSVSRSGYHSLFGSLIVNGSGQNITTAALSHSAASTAEWPAFRNYSSNMATVSASTAQGSWQVKENWTTSLGALGSYGTLTTSNIVIYDRYLYVATEHGLSKIDQSTGGIVTTSPLSKGASYVLQIAYGNGKIFVTNATGIDAFDAFTMERVWSAAISSYGNYMATTPILYDDSTKTIYVGDYGDSKNTLGTYGGYSAINASDGSSKWILYGGATDAHYCAGAVIAGNYLVFGSDSGTLTSVNKNTTDINAYGSLTATAGALAVTGKIRSSIAYDGTYLYFTTNSGYIYKVSINADNGALTTVSSRQFSSSGSSSTTVVYNGKIYVGANDGVYILNSSDLSQASFAAQSGPVQSSGLLTTSYGGAVYVYFTVNSARGEIIVLKDDGTNVSYDTLYTPSHAQYCTGSLVADSSGTIYYSNDSGYLSAITNTNTVNTNNAKAVFEVIPSSLFDSSTYTTAYPTITVKDNSDAKVVTVAEGTYYLGEGSYTYTISLSGYTTLNGSFTIAASDISTGIKKIPVALSKPSPSDIPSNITTNVSVLGYGGGSIFSNRAITVQRGESAWNAVKKALDDAGISYAAKNTSFGVYISSVNGLVEFDKGANSGWEYTVNGTKPSVGISQYTLSSGDKVVLYYTADYTVNSSSIKSNPANAELTATINSSTGVASATFNGDALTAFTKTLSSQSDTSGSKATINVSTPTGATGTALTLPQSVVAALSNKSNTSLCIETEVANLTFEPAVIDKIFSSAGRNNVTVSISKLDNSFLSEENRVLVGSHPVYDLSITASSTKITSFGDGLVNISTPYTPKNGEDTSRFAVYYIDSEGKAMKMSGASYDTDSSCIVFTTNHFSTFAVVYGEPKSFDDVAESNWYYNAVRYVSQRGLMSGTSDTSFESNKNMSRAMLVTVLYRLASKPAVIGENSFSDVQEGQWYTDAVKWASTNGIVSGYGNGLFGTDDSVTREQMATILYNYARNRGCDITKASDLKVFADALDVSNWAGAAMSWANAGGLIKGVTKTTILPSGNATRAQVATILMRFCENYVK